MSKTGNKELAAALTSKHGLSKPDAEKFISAMFDVVGEGLQADKQVKVKGLGTFKIVGVASRKSIDVNTGEAIIIEGRDKITFAPDASLRDDVNRPFAQFETVVINDGVDFSEIDKKYDTTHEATETIAVDDSPKEEPVLEKEIPVEEKEVPVEEKEVPVAEKEEPAVVDEPATTQELPAEEKTEEPAIEQAEEPVIEQTKESTIEEGLATEEEKTQKEETVASSADSNNAEEELEEPSEPKKHRTLKYVCVAATVLVLALGVSAFYLFNQLKLRDNRIEHLESQITGKSTQKPVAKAAKQTIAKPDAQTAAQPKGDAPKTTSANAPESTTDYQAFSKKDARIRTGAYVIVGIDHTVTAKSGQTLSSISRAQLGPGMECYIEAVNGGRTEFEAGEKVNVPKLRLKKIVRTEAQRQSGK